MLQTLGVHGLLELLYRGRGGGEHGWDGDLGLAVCAQGLFYALRPVTELAERQVRTAHEAELRRGIEVLPHAGVARLDAFQLGVVYDVHRRALADMEGLKIKFIQDILQFHSVLDYRIMCLVK